MLFDATTYEVMVHRESVSEDCLFAEIANSRASHLCPDSEVPEEDKMLL